MARDRSLVRASDIGSWLFCHRAWWLARVQRAPHERPEALQAGTRVHTAHGEDVKLAGRLQRVGLFFVGAGLILSLLLLVLSFL